MARYDSRQDDELLNHPPVLQDYNVFATDQALVGAVRREGAEWCEQRLLTFGKRCGSAELLEAGNLANRYPPELHTHDRFGHRLDEVRFHPAYHQLMQHVFNSGLHSLAWTAERPGAHVAHAAMVYMMAQTETGVCCPAAMTYAAVPSLRTTPELADEWLPRILTQAYDGNFRPPAEKSAATIGMAMTEKQGGSDVRANTTRASAAGNDGEYLLNGHKWFCSAPMSDAFLTLAYIDDDLSCFLVPRWLPDGERNCISIQRLKDKCGNRSNASGEIEYHDTWGQLLGERGAGVRTIIEMVHHTRLDASLAPAGIMRQALVQAIHHARHRTVFQKKLVDQPLMENVLADMALEVEAALLMVMRVARAFDEAQDDAAADAFSRIATPVTKFWVNKRTPNLVYEAMECLGGGGYVEESILPRLYREAPLNGIWEGSGNVITLDILRALERNPQCGEAFVLELELARGNDARFDTALQSLTSDLRAGAVAQTSARALAQQLALLLQASLMLRHAPARGTAFCQLRLGDGGWVYGANAGVDGAVEILEHAWPD
ncbi:MAG: acyl-CoA dehydrogenase family protein [Gammaproteobacteria bacterium]|nr:acyl-CoA dehydrogenase family protein [Gammaproteobacteria bacterium]